MPSARSALSARNLFLHHDRNATTMPVPAPGVSAPAVGLQYITARVLAAETRACAALVALPVAGGF